MLYDYQLQIIKDYIFSLSKNEKGISNIDTNRKDKTSNVI